LAALVSEYEAREPLVGIFLFLSGKKEPPYPGYVGSPVCPMTSGGDEDPTNKAGIGL
jgi:hypothetical protein